METARWKQQHAEGSVRTLIRAHGVPELLTRQVQAPMKRTMSSSRALCKMGIAR